MGFGGAVHAMITSLKNNSRSRKKIREVLKDYDKQGLGYKGKLTFKEVTPEELERIKSTIKRKFKRQRIITASITVPIVSALFVILALKINANYQEEVNYELKQKYDKLVVNKPETKVNERFIYNLTEGYNRLDKGDYKKAKSHFKRAFDLKSNDYMTVLALTTVYIYDCMENNKDCNTAQDLFNVLIEHFSEQPEVIDLNFIYTNFLKTGKYNR